MLLLLPIFALFATIAAECQSDKHQACINVYNKCPFTVWPGIQGSTIPEGGGFRLHSGESRQLSVPNGWSGGKIWARTGCDENFNCDTGFCGYIEQCQGRGGQPPVTVAEITLYGEGEEDYYDVSLADGYNLPILIIPRVGTYHTNGALQEVRLFVRLMVSKMCGNCYVNVNDQCPNPLKVVKNGHTVACKSACLGFNTDEDCCRGPYDSAEHCPNSTYAKIAKKCCPTALSHAYDYKTSTCFCRGSIGKSAAYNVEFC